MAGVTIIVDGKPVPWQRAVPVMIAEYPMMKTPKNTRSYQELIRQLGKIAMGPRAPFLGALELLVIATLERPKSVDRRRPWVQHTGDVDDYSKSAQDALNGIAFNDNSQICELRAVKRYCDRGERPSLRIEVYQLDVEDDE